MPDKKKKKSLMKRLLKKYRFIIFNHSTYEEVFAKTLSPFFILINLALFGILTIVLTIVLISYTPLREYIPSGPDSEMRHQLQKTVYLIDSLETQINERDRMLNNIRTIVDGGAPDNNISELDTNVNHENIHFERSPEDSLMRENIESQESFGLQEEPAPKQGDSWETGPNLSELYFFTPLGGMITNEFDITRQHYGVDIVAEGKTSIHSILDGTVTLTEWSLETGNVIQIQHAGNLISVYKHNSKLIKKQGDRVKAGDVIAIVGNSGELSTGPHLHFELWHNGAPLNPEEYIDF